jgi:methionyl-tRNA synthetase
MKILDLLTAKNYCKACGDFYPASALITMSGYQGGKQNTGSYCLECAKEIIEEDEE